MATGSRRLANLRRCAAHKLESFSTNCEKEVTLPLRPEHTQQIPSIRILVNLTSPAIQPMKTPLKCRPFFSAPIRNSESCGRRRMPAALCRGQTGVPAQASGPGGAKWGGLTSAATRFRASLASAGLAIVLAGCSSTPAKVDRGPIPARTFSFVNPASAPAARWRPVHAMIQDAITANLTKQGIAKADAGGDVTVGYLLVVGNNASIVSVSDYLANSEDPDKLVDKAHAAYAGSKNPNYFEAGTLVIDLIDARSFKLLKRGYATRPVLRNPSADARAANIQAAVDDILRDLRITP